MAVLAFFNSGVLTVHSVNAAPDVPEYSDDAVDDPSAPLDSANNLKQIAIAVHASMLASAASTSALKTPRQPPANQSPMPGGALGRRIKRS